MQTQGLRMYILYVGQVLLHINSYTIQVNVIYNVFDHLVVHHF